MTRSRKHITSPFQDIRLPIILAASSMVSVGLFVVRTLSAGNMNYFYLVWNLFLAWLPLAFGWWLIVRAARKRWLSAGNAVLFLLWLGFLPNAFYIVSDLIHLRVTGDVSILYDVVMFTSFVWNGFLLGFVSVYGMHQQLRQKFGAKDAHLAVAVVLLLCSFAIYLGRYLRWNSWDVLVNPAGLIFDVSDRFINPASHPQTFTTTLMFFVLLSSMYWVLYELVEMLRQSPRQRK